MANVAKFDRDEVLAKATWLFWSQGFQATSTRDIQQAVNMRPGSMYAAFGGKSDLYRLVLENYAHTMSTLLDQHVSEEADIPSGIRKFIARILLDVDTNEVAESCLLYRTLAELGGEHKELLEYARERLQGMEAKFIQLIGEAVIKEQLPPSTDVRAEAVRVQCAILGMRSYLRINHDRELVQSMIDELLVPQ